MTFQDLVTRIKNARGPEAKVLGFDPANGNETARFLFLLESPGPGAVISGMVSIRNGDSTATNLRNQLAHAGFVPADYAIWNVVPWFLGSGEDARKPSAADLKDAEPHLKTLVETMEKNNLKCIVLVGSTARKVLVPLSKFTKVRIASIHHPSAQSMLRELACVENREILVHLRRSIETAS